MRERYILLIEDNPDDELLALLAFQQNGMAHPVKVARDGAEAIHFLEHCPTDDLPCLTLLDLKLPKVSGLEVLSWIRSRPETRTLPVVVLTSSKEEQDLLTSYHLGANSYVRKPVEFEAFVQAAQTLGQYWIEMNLLPDAS